MGSNHASHSAGLKVKCWPTDCLFGLFPSSHQIKYITRFENWTFVFETLCNIYLLGVTMETVQKRDNDVVEMTPFERNYMMYLFVFFSLFKHLPAG